MSSVQLSDLFPGIEFHKIEQGLFIEARERLDNLTKPRGSLGRLEEVAARLYAIGGGRTPLSADPAMMLTVAADHGVAAQKVSPFPQKVTQQMVENFLAGGAAINALCRAAGMDLRIIDAGCSGKPSQAHPLLLERRLGNGTKDISENQAMSLEACVKGLRLGFELAADMIKAGYACIACGEMGIANSTSASALYCAYLDLDPDIVTGPGAGASPEMLARKRSVVANALKHSQKIIDSGDPVRILAALGGYEIVILCGIMLGCAAFRTPALVDGFICAAAFVAARAIFPDMAEYAFLTHISAEPGFCAILEKMPDVAMPLLDLRMRLGEGSGCAAAFPLLRAGAAIFNEMATLHGAGINATEADRQA